MKNLIKVGLIGFLVGEFISLYYKDKNFKEKFDSLKGFDKCKFVFNELFELNKKCFFDLKQKDYSNIYNQLRQSIEENIGLLEEKMIYIKENIDKLSEEKIKPIIKELNKKIDDLQNQIDKLNEKYDLENKISNLKKQFEIIKSKIG